MKNGNKKDVCYINKLLNYKDNAIVNIYDVANILNASRSSTSRFIQRVGYDYFKNFKKDFNDNIKNNNDPKISVEDLKKSGIAILCSKRSSDVAFTLKKMFSKRYDTVVFEDLVKNVGQWIIENQKRVFLLYTITGDSHRFNIALIELAKLKIDPKIVIVTFSKYLSIFKKYDYMEILFANKKKTEPKTWNDCNIAISQMLATTFSYFED